MTRPPHWIAPPGPVAGGLRIGLLGGSFDPAHDGHLYVSLVALHQLRLDYVWWLVSPGNPLKPAPNALAARLVLARIEARHPRIRVTDIEAQFGTRYAIDTVAALQRRFPQAGFIWLMGSDNLVQFSRWRRWQALAARIPIVVVRRPGSVLASLNAPLAQRGGVAAMLDGRRNPQSATRLRAIRALGMVNDAMLNLTP